MREAARDGRRASRAANKAAVERFRRCHNDAGRGLAIALRAFVQASPALAPPPPPPPPPQILNTMASDPNLDPELVGDNGGEPTAADPVTHDDTFPTDDAPVVGTDQEAPTSEAPVDEAEKLRGEVRDLKDKYLRLMAEFDNFRKRTARERLQERSTAAESTIRSILPVVDDFDRAKATTEDPANDESFTEGVELVYAKLKRTMESLGAKQMTSTGEPFDPDLMEAFTKIQAGPDMAGKVVDTIEPGYFLNDKLIRHAKVVIGQ